MEWESPAHDQQFPATRCFVIQPFDRGVFDDRFDDVIQPAVTAAGLTPYRVDRDPSADILIDQIQKEIRLAVVCLADISNDNPNVWLELGFALALGKPVVMICSDQRQVLPFDIRHRAVIFYQTGTPRHFEELKTAITTKLLSTCKVNSHATPGALTSFDTDVLHAIATDVESLNSPMAFARIAGNFPSDQLPHLKETLSSLAGRGFVVSHSSHAADSEPAFTISRKGLNWLNVRDTAVGLVHDGVPDEPF